MWLRLAQVAAAATETQPGQPLSSLHLPLRLTDHGVCGKFVCGWLSYFFFFFYSLSWRRLLRLLGPSCTARRVAVAFAVAVAVASFVRVINRRVASVAAQWLLSLLCLCVALPASSPAPLPPTTTATSSSSCVVLSCALLVLVVFVLAAVVVAVALVVAVMAEPIGRVDGSMAFRLSFGNLRVATTQTTTTTASGLGSCLVEWKVLCGWPSLAN